MYIYSDHKVNNPQMPRNPSINKSMSFLGANSMKQTINSEKNSLDLKNQFLQSYSSLNKKNSAFLKSNTKSIQTINCDIQNPNSSKSMKPSNSSFNFNVYSDSYRNWVSGIKNFSSTMSEKKWQLNHTAIKFRKSNTFYKNNHVNQDNKVSLNIQKFDPTIDSDKMVNQVRNKNFSSQANEKNLSLPKFQSIEKNSNDWNSISIRNFESNFKSNLPLNQNIKNKILNMSEQVNSDNNSPKNDNFASNTIYSTNRFGLNIPNFKKTVSSTIYNHQSSRVQKKFNDETKIIYSRLSKLETNKSNSINSSNDSNEKIKKEEMINKFTSLKSQEISSPQEVNEKEKTEKEKEIENFHKKLFDRKIKARLDYNKIDSITKPHLEYIDNKVDSMKNKILLMKGVFDYVYPKIVLKKAEEISNTFKQLKSKDKGKTISQEKEDKKENQFDNFPFQIQNFKTIKSESIKSERKASISQSSKRGQKINVQRNKSNFNFMKKQNKCSPIKISSKY